MTTSKTLATGRFLLTGIDCAKCTRAIEARLLGMDGVAKAGVNYFTDEALVEYDPEKATPSKIVSRIREAGYGAFETHGRMT